MVSINLRLPSDLHKAIKASGKRNERSLNSEIIYAIKLYLGQVEKPDQPEQEPEPKKQ